MIRLTQTTQFERVVNLLEDEAWRNEDEARGLLDFVAFLSDKLSGHDPWLKNKRCLDLLSRLQDVLSAAEDEADNLICKARGDMETAGQNALDLSSEARWEE